MSESDAPPPSAADVPLPPPGPADAPDDIATLRAELAALKTELSRERARRHAAEEHARSVRRESTLNQIRVEEEEEAISNKLMKRLSELKQEKEQIARASESDSEWVANSFSQRLEELQRQKQQIIAAAEEENEFIVNRLNKELEAVRTEKLELERKLHRISRSTTPGALTPTSSPALSLRSNEGVLSRTGSYRLPGSGTATSSGNLPSTAAFPPHTAHGHPPSSNPGPDRFSS